MKRRGLIFALSFLVALFTVAVLAPAALAYRMDVPVWKQGDPRWAGAHLGGSSYTMARSGCAVTAVAMVAAYFGSTKDPGALVRALNANGGLNSAGDLYWQRVPAAAGGSVKYVARFGYSSLARINQEIDAGYPVIVKVNRRGNTHFVVITGRSGSTYYINDPAEGDRSTLNARYGAPGRVILGFRVFRGTPPSPSEGLVTRYEQNSGALVYKGGWSVSSGAAASAGSFRYADARGGSITVTFKGTFLAWVAKKSPVYGKASVSVDGGPAATVDLYSARATWQQRVWETGPLASGTHTVKIRWTGTKRSSASGTNIGIDAFDVLGKLAAAR